MFTVQDDWIQYETAPVRRTAVRGGAACAQRIPVRRVVATRPAGSVQDRAARARLAPAAEGRTTLARPVAHRAVDAAGPLRLTRRGRFVLLVLPGLVAASAVLAAVAPLATPVPASVSTPAPMSVALR